MSGKGEGGGAQRPLAGLLWRRESVYERLFVAVTVTLKTCKAAEPKGSPYHPHMCNARDMCMRICAASSAICWHAVNLVVVFTPLSL